MFWRSISHSRFALACAGWLRWSQPDHGQILQSVCAPSTLTLTYVATQLFSGSERFDDTRYTLYAIYAILWCTTSHARCTCLHHALYPIYLIHVSLHNARSAITTIHFTRYTLHTIDYALHTMHRGGGRWIVVGREATDGATWMATDCVCTAAISPRAWHSPIPQRNSSLDLQEVTVRFGSLCGGSECCFGRRLASSHSWPTTPIATLDV